nr:MAG TPA: hypothetical protein [Caudoviricetes sp.]
MYILLMLKLFCQRFGRLYLDKADYQMCQFKPGGEVSTLLIFHTQQRRNRRCNLLFPLKMVCLQKFS